MGAKIKVGNGFIEATVEGRLQGAKIYLDFPSVGATENLIMAAALAEGTTTLENAAKEPECWFHLRASKEPSSVTAYQSGNLDVALFLNQ